MIRNLKAARKKNGSSMFVRIPECIAGHRVKEVSAVQDLIPLKAATAETGTGSASSCPAPSAAETFSAKKKNKKKK